MEYLAYFFIPAIFLALLVISAKNNSAEITGNIRIYQYPSFLKIILILGTVVLIVLIIAKSPSSNTEIIKELSSWQAVGGLIIIFIFNPLVSLYFVRTKVILFEDKIVKVTPFKNIKIKYANVKKIVNYHSSGNPGAAMTRLYADKKMTLEALINGHDELVSEVIFRCDNAVVVDKQK